MSTDLIASLESMTPLSLIDTWALQKRAAARIEELEARVAEMDPLRQTLEIIAVGDATNAMECAAQALIQVGHWNAEKHEEFRHMLPQPAAPTSPAGRNAALDDVLSIVEKEREFCIENKLHLGTAACLAIGDKVRKLKEEHAASLVVPADPK